MIVTRLILNNWRNFREVDISLRDRMFLVGPNASGKSNLLDVFRFMRDIAKPTGGGLQAAVQARGSIKQIRCLAAHSKPDIHIELHMSDSVDNATLWKYIIEIAVKKGGNNIPVVKKEIVYRENECILDRPNDNDIKDPQRLTQTHMENVNENKDFRDLVSFLADIHYFHLIPQLVQHPDLFKPGNGGGEDSYGHTFLQRIRSANKNSRESRIKKIDKALNIAVPQLKDLSYVVDKGIPHLEVRCDNWRPNSGFQREDQFSDGTLRLIAFLWSILETNSILLFEEPELSLHTSIVRQLPQMIHSILSTKKKKQRQQVFISTHSPDLISEKSIGGNEIVILSPHPEGTNVQPASSYSQVSDLLSQGLSPAEAIIPYTEPKNIQQLSLFND